jgi:hypothetical protein
MKNVIEVTGTIKNIKTYTKEGKGTMLTGWFDQRDVSRTSDGTADRTVYVVGMNIVAFDDSTVADILGASSAGKEVTLPITLTGRMVTKFDTRPNIEESKRYKPLLQLEVHDASIVSFGE